MKYFALLILFMLTSCSTPLAPSPTATTALTSTTAPAAATPSIETPETHCKQGISIDRTILNLTDDGKQLLVRFVMTDNTGGVQAGNEYGFNPNDKVTFALYKEDDTYLVGVAAPAYLFTCYTGTDIPWANGELAAECAMSIPTEQLAEPVQVGQAIRVKTIGYGSFTTQVESEPQE
jgi:hypothetical protein